MENHTRTQVGLILPLKGTKNHYNVKFLKDKTSIKQKEKSYFSQSNLKLFLRIKNFQG